MEAQQTQTTNPWPSLPCFLPRSRNSGRTAKEIPWTQIEAPPHSLQMRLWRRCTQIAEPPHGTHFVFSRPCFSHPEQHIAIDRKWISGSTSAWAQQPKIRHIVMGYKAHRADTWTPTCAAMRTHFAFDNAFVTGWRLCFDILLQA